MTNQTNALLYLRAAYADDDDVIEQRHQCTALADARDWGIVDVIVDNGVSGTGDPPGLTILRDRIASGEAQAIIATELTRLSRDPKRIYAFARFCRLHGADLCFAEQTVNLDILLMEAGFVEAADEDTTPDSDRESGFQPIEFRL